MREYILTEHERAVLQTFLEKGVKVTNFRTLTFRMRKNLQKLKQDIDLITQALEMLKT